MCVVFIQLKFIFRFGWNVLSTQILLSIYLLYKCALSHNHLNRGHFHLYTKRTMLRLTCVFWLLLLFYCCCTYCCMYVCIPKNHNTRPVLFSNYFVRINIYTNKKNNDFFGSYICTYVIHTRGLLCTCSHEKRTSRRTGSDIITMKRAHARTHISLVRVRFMRVYIIMFHTKIKS